MRSIFPGLLLVAIVSACSDDAGQSPTAKRGTPPDLETAAIAAGVIADPDGTDPTGLYARDTDRVCIIPARVDFRIGVFVDYGEQQACSGSGAVTRAGESLHVRFDAAPGCDFDARFEGDRIVFPGRVPEACAKLCQGRASLAALNGERLSDSVSEASTLRDAKGRLLCGAGG